MPPVRFRIRTIMIVIVAVAMLMIPLRIIVSLDPRQVVVEVVWVIQIAAVSMIYFAPFVGFSLALQKLVNTLRFRSKSVVFCTRHPDLGPNPATCGEAERV
jgi:hypothetical protein